MKWTIEDQDIEWTMEWSKCKGNEDHADEQVFEDHVALAHLLINEVIFLNSHWWRKELPDDFKNAISVNVDCSDVFAWGCADAEGLPCDQIENLYRMWRKDQAWGAAVWCMIKRNQMPQKPVENIIRKAGIWDLDKLGLGTNTMDAEIAAFFDALCNRKFSEGEDLASPSASGRGQPSLGETTKSEASVK